MSASREAEVRAETVRRLYSVAERRAMALSDVEPGGRVGAMMAAACFEPWLDDTIAGPLLVTAHALRGRYFRQAARAACDEELDVDTELALTVQAVEEFAESRRRGRGCGEASEAELAEARDRAAELLP